MLHTIPFKASCAPAAQRINYVFSGAYYHWWLVLFSPCELVSLIVCVILETATVHKFGLDYYGRYLSPSVDILCQ